MIRGPDDRPAPAAEPRRGKVPRRALIWACVALVVLTWTPVLALHVRNMSVTDPATGTLVVVFPLTESTRDLFRSVAEARGAPVGPVDWIPRAWIVQSTESGFAGRLRQRGAWGVYAPNLLSMRQVLSCSGMVTPPPSSGGVQPPRPAT